MAKLFYCSICGIELTHTLKAIAGKGIIVNLISPHECEGFAMKGPVKNKRTVLDIVDNAKKIGKPKLVKEVKKDEPFSESEDKRPDSIRLDTIAPKGILDAVRRPL